MRDEDAPRVVEGQPLVRERVSEDADLVGQANVDQEESLRGLDRGGSECRFPAVQRYV
ncbi:hypothetical protein PN419_16080 [Halorubrum ezzemoulense]|nr:MULTISPECIES: hypothetical protein [Halorubrum]MDB2225683.1 hypothetical protein [Halorubrum ezzemoulense]MDB2241855.1 hypothetical protein [Halorubrum ezzemoulense]MDB2270700.1 hypothetical protein [Halorubrum ezzemoulense]MDB9250500.1 hypothetical protein [Halorubrum ezzemoulense]MDB9260642.1 hypothetical protein [Halorubrum ezzemoulense]